MIIGDREKVIIERSKVVGTQKIDFRILCIKENNELIPKAGFAHSDRPIPERVLSGFNVNVYDLIKEEDLRIKKRN